MEDAEKLKWVLARRVRCAYTEQTFDKKKKCGMCIILDILSLQVIVPNLQAAFGVLNVNPRN